MHAVILLVASCYGNWDKLPLDGTLSFSTDFTFPVSGCCTYFGFGFTTFNQRGFSYLFGTSHDYPYALQF